MSQAAGVERADLIERFRIPFVWRLLNCPGEPSDKCRSPFREDRHPSFSIFDDGKAFQDFSTGDAGNVFRFYGLVTGCGPLNEYREFKRFLASKGYAVAANGENTPASSAFKRLSTPPEGEDSGPERKDALKTALALLRTPNVDELYRIAQLRGLSPTAPFLASNLGCLLVGSIGGFESWVLTDTARKCAEARRMDGEKFPQVGPLKERKAHTLKGSKKNWPLGLVPNRREYWRIPRILWVEGGPDYLAACHWIGCYCYQWDVLPVTMLGAMAGSAGLDEEALELLKGRRIRIIAHTDAGDAALDKAAQGWARILQTVGCDVDALNVRKLHPGAKDLNDLTRLLSPEQQQTDARNLLP